MNVIALILAGGSGTRLWPLSRQTMPKQLLSLTENRTLLQETCRRIWPVVSPEKEWIITGDRHFFQVRNQVEGLRNEFETGPIRDEFIQVLKEPMAKNTAPAIFWATKRCLDIHGEDSVLIVLPSDHLITKEEEFVKVLRIAVRKAIAGHLVTFGIKPTHPETGFGYIKIADTSYSISEAHPVGEFVEKPDCPTAVKYLEEGNYLWNSGMFAFHVGTLLKEARLYCPDIVTPFIECNIEDNASIKEAYKETTAQSIDYALMEKTNKAYVVPASIGWTDIGSWERLYEISPKDSYGNVVHGEPILIDTKNTFIYGKDRLVATIGLEKIAVIDTPDALMICPLNQTQRVKEVVEKLKDSKSKMHIEHLTVERPWGNYTVIQQGPGYKIKKIVVQPKQSLSMQMHYHRSEHWIVVRGTAKISNGQKETFVHENESTYIPKSTLHRLENPGKIPLEIIEAQCGTYLEEDDIVRYDDSYGRI